MDRTVTSLPIYHAMADAFVAEGVDTFFALMGDGNMHWATAMKGKPGMKSFFARHEHCAVAMAAGYHGATGKVGVASVTCGPGFTQIITVLTTASRNRVPLVVFAGEPPIGNAWYGQQVDQAALTVPTGAHYIAAHNPKLIHNHVRQAFYIARQERHPVVLGVPYDMQKQAMPDLGTYSPARTILPDIGAPLPDAGQIALVAEKLLGAACPVIVAGRGVLEANAEALIEELADRVGALLATTLPARGLFDHHPFSLGISGGYSRELTREVAASADFVLTFGASLSFYTVDGGRLYPKAEIAQVDLDPRGYNQGLRAGDIHLRGDVGAAAKALLDALGSRNSNASVRTNSLAERLGGRQEDATPFDIEPGLVDPRDVVAALDEVIPKDFATVEGSGHNSFFPTVMRGRNPRRHIAYKEFGAIGNAISFAIGAAAVHGDGRTLLIEGDGSFLMHVQELETVQRHGLKLLFVIMNDGAYGAEIHKLRSEGLDDGGAVFGRTDFAAIARGFGLSGATVTDVAQLPGLYAEFENGSLATVWDVRISDRVVSPRMRSGIGRGHGKH
jgi:thiamine pyrophosphate-dependent acetolactate synthase large subunit-like protein